MYDIFRHGIHSFFFWPCHSHSCHVTHPPLHLPVLSKRLNYLFFKIRYQIRYNLLSYLDQFADLQDYLIFYLDKNNSEYLSDSFSDNRKDRK